LNRQVRTGKLLPVLGPANMLTEMRGLGASFLLGRLCGGIGTSSSLALWVFTLSMLTDILDGQIAKRTGTQSKLGQIIDGETDFCLYLAITLILLQNGLLPLWLGLLILLRFLIPLIAALASYFLCAHPVRFGSTLWGKIAGSVQCFYFFVLLAPAQLASLTRMVQLPLLILMVSLLVIAPIAQILANLRIKI
jgi:phosphatidylglycerophosphate synthase